MSSLEQRSKTALERFDWPLTTEVTKACLRHCQAIATSHLVRCEICAVGVHLACAVDCSEWSGKVGEPGGYFDRRDILRGALLCCKCFDEYLPYVWADEPESTANGGTYESREGELPWWVTDVEPPLSPQ